MTAFLQIVITGVIGGFMAWCIIFLPTLFLDNYRAKKKRKNL